MSETSLHLKVDMLNEVNGRLRAVNDELRTENERLKRKLEILKAHRVEIVDAVAGGFEVYSEDYRRADALKGENKKLRELAKGALHCKGGWCFDCPIVDDDKCRKKKLMQELGIEVDDE